MPIQTAESLEATGLLVRRMRRRDVPHQHGTASICQTLLLTS